MKSLPTLIVAASLLAACGLVDTTTTAAVGAKSKAAELEQAKATQQKVLSDIEKAQQQSEQRLKEAESK